MMSELTISALTALIWVLGTYAWRTRHDNRHAERATLEDVALAQWARTTVLTVITKTGYVYATPLSGLRTHPGGSDRAWSDPISVTIWAQDDPTAFEFHEIAIDSKD